MKKAIKETLEQMRATFESQSYDELKVLKPIQQAPIRIDGKRYYPAVWAEILPNDAVLLVVELTHWYFLNWFGSTDCIGFTLTEVGERQYVDADWLMTEIGYP